MTATAKPKINQMDISTMYPYFKQPFPVGLTLKLNAGTPSKQIDVVWTILYIQGVASTSFTKTIILPATGASGNDLDTGNATNDTWYYIWAIAKDDSTISIILSASSTTPTLPSGYTKKRLISFVRHATAAFADFVQRDNKWFCTTSTPVANYRIIETTYVYNGAELTNRDISAFVPLLVTNIEIRQNLSWSDASARVWWMYIGGYCNGSPIQVQTYSASINVASAGSWQSSVNTIYTDNRQLYWRAWGNGGTDATVDIYLIGFEVPLN